MTVDHPTHQPLHPVVAALLALAGVAAVALAQGGCTRSPGTPLTPTIATAGFSGDVDVGPVTFFTRIDIRSPEDLRPDEMRTVISAYDIYGDVQPVWVDRERKTFDLTVGGARLEFAGSFVQENLDLARDNNVPWRLEWVRYRENFAARQASFRLTGQVRAGVEVALDIGDGFQPVDIDEDGRYDVQIPFSDRRRVAFLRTSTGDIVQYGQVTAGVPKIAPISYAEYQRARREATPVPDVPVEIPEPLVGIGDDGQPQTRPQSLPAGGGNGAISSDPAFNAAAGNSPRNELANASANANSNSGTRATANSDGYATPSGFPPKILTRQVSIDVHLVFDGIDENDPSLSQLRQALLAYNFQRDRFDPDTGYYWFFCKVLDVGDIKRVHQAVRAWARDAEIPIVSRSRYFGVKMELVRQSGELTTTLRGTTLPDATITLWPRGPKDPVKITSNAAGQWSVSLDVAEPVVPATVVAGARTQWLRIDTLSGVTVEISQREFRRLMGMEPLPATNE
ncbi:MAG: hypothetical protein AB7K09_02905 [Planctomycetota bacterium]